MDNYNQTAEHAVKEKAGEFYIPKSQTAALLIHGFTGTPYNLRGLGEFLSSQGITVLGVRLAGHGSHPADLARTNYAHWLHSAREGLRRLAGEYKHIFIIGYSFGGNLALRLANENEAAIRGVALLNMPIRLKWHRLIKSVLPFYKQFHSHWRKKWISRHIINDYLDQGNYHLIPLKSLEHFLNFIDRFTISDLRIFNLPALIMHSADDRLVDSKSAQVIFDQIASTVKELHWLDSAEHNPLLVSHKEKVFEKILEFIKKTSENDPDHSPTI